MIFQRGVTSGPTLLLGCLFSPLLLADNSALELKAQTVSAPSVESTTVADMAQYGSKVEIVTRQQIERAGPSADITRAMQMFIPGFYVAPKNGPFDYGTYSLLGGRNDDTLILLDGVRLNNRLYGGLYLDTLPANAVERIEVLKGGQSLLFGTQAVAGSSTSSPAARRRATYPAKPTWASIPLAAPPAMPGPSGFSAMAWATWVCWPMSAITCPRATSPFVTAT